VRYVLALGIVLSAIWMLWSGHTEPLILTLGFLSCVATVWLAWKMRIVDDESVPYWMGIRPFVVYLPWLAKEIVLANIDVAGRILRREMPIRPCVVLVHALQRSELGRVILANSITLTPGTVSIDMQGERIWVHALSYEEAEHQDLSGDMNRRVRELER
jgi:multicomponent Na+:H+ antiporter subunit E